MSIGMIILVALALLILFGVMERVLDRMALTDKQALILVAAVFIGGLLPDFTFGPVTLNPGGALVPFGVCIYLLIHAGTGKERGRALLSALLTAAAVYAISIFFPAEPETMPFDPLMLYGLSGGLIAWILGRSRRSAFISGILGVTLADIITNVMLWRRGIQQTLHLGSAGALDAVVISGLTAVLLCELLGEIMERITSSSSHDAPIKGGNHA